MVFVLKSFFAALLILVLCTGASLASSELNLGFIPGQIISAAENTIFIVDQKNNQIKILDENENLSVYAGSEKAGYKNGMKDEASFQHPHGMVADKFGNLYISDTFNNAIRKIDKTGLVTTFAGSGIGFADGKATEAKFNSPMGLAIDKESNLYVADQRNQRIRKISPSGEVTTIAGLGFEGYKDGAGHEAMFSYPEAVAVGMDGNIYVADKVNHAIRVISKAGVVSTLTGKPVRGFLDGSLNLALFDMPSDLSVDSLGNLLVVDSRNNAIRKIDLKNSNVITVYGSNLTATESGLNGPCTLLKLSDKQFLVGERTNLSLMKLSI